MTTTLESTSTSVPLAEAILLLPGYDPYRDAGDCVFVEERAAHVIGFFHDCLTHVKGALADTPLLLAPWQQGFLGNLFGWIRPDGTRRYREALLYVARKNSKTTMLAGIGNYMLFADGEKGSEQYCAAAEKEQAALTWDIAKLMIQNEPALDDACKIYNARRSITIESIGSYFRPLSSESKTKHGFNVHYASIDELHVHKSGDLYDVLSTGTASRSQPIVAIGTTADYERPGSICNEKHDYAKDVISGRIKDPYFLPAVFEVGKDEDWEDEENWKKANPNLGISLPLEYLRKEYLKAKASALRENWFRRFHLNQRTEQNVRWLTKDAWDRCGGTLDPAKFRGRQCWGGLDLGNTSDLTSLCLVFPEEKEGEDGKMETVAYDALWWFWTPEETARAREAGNHRAAYLTWARDGWMELTPGNETDYRHIRKRVNGIADDFGLQDLAVDRLFQGVQLCQDLADDGLNVVPFGQGFFSMAGPTWAFDSLVTGGAFHHGDNPVLAWMAGNATVVLDPAGSMKPDKSKSGGKIDGLVTAIMALARAMASERTKKASYRIFRL